MTYSTSAELGGTNVCAFLDMIAWSEIGTQLLAKSDNGYNVLVGSVPSKPLLFQSYAAHPNILNEQCDSTAAGRYQLLHRYFIAYQAELHLPDFSPHSQDLIAVQQIRECAALNDAAAGRLDAAIGKCCHIWASLHGSPYGQHTNSLEALQTAYLAASGTLAQ